MSNTDIKKIIQEEYKIDVDAIRNLSKLANDLTVNNKLIVPGGLEIEGKLSVKGDVNSTGNGYFGPAYIGKYDTNNSDFAQFSHKDLSTNTRYALLQDKKGDTILNTANRGIYFRIKNSTKMEMKTNGDLNVSEKVTVGKGSGIPQEFIPKSKI